MGLFWDLIQQSQISDQRQQGQSIEYRVDCLEKELFKTRKIVHELVSILEKEHRRDIDGDGQIG